MQWYRNQKMKQYHPQKPIKMNFTKTITTRLEWEDLVLDNTVLQQVQEIKAWLEHGDTLMHDWGLEKILKPGYSCLFYGPEGTGKTLTATLLGKVTGREVYRVSLSVLVSKYIGETEKNLERVFAQAEEHKAILFFDEADALFGKRTEVKDAHDKYANQEVSYLLQRIEDFPGVIILATNLKSNMDAAFLRRFRSIVHFNMPAAAERLQLWKNIFGKGKPLDAGIDLQDIAAKYELSGEQIVNVLRHCMLWVARHHAAAVSKDCLLDGIRNELKRTGKD